METKMVRVPFEVGLAKEITNGNKEGRIVTRDGENVRIVCFDRKDEYRPIIVLIKNGDMENVYALGVDGKETKGDTIGTKDLMLEIPEYMTYKDGDVLSFDNSIIGILNGKFYKDKSGEFYCKAYVCTNSKNKAVFLEFPFSAIEVKKAIEEEKQRLIEALKASKEPKAKEYLKRFFGIRCW